MPRRAHCCYYQLAIPRAPPTVQTLHTCVRKRHALAGAYSFGIRGKRAVLDNLHVNIGIKLRHDFIELRFKSIKLLFVRREPPLLIA